MSSARRSATRTDVALSVHGPEDLVHAVPYLLGFHPHHSLVVVGMHAGELVVTVRMDLDDLALDGVLENSLVAMHRGGADEFVAIVFDDRVSAGHDLPWRGLAVELVELAARYDSTLVDSLLVDDRRRWSLLCADPGCCPVEGIPLDADRSTVPATATFAGLAAYPDREALDASLAPDEHRDALLPLVTGCVDELVLVADSARRLRSVKRRLFAAARACSGPSAEPLDDDTVAAFGAALTSVEFRDAVWLAVDSGRIDGRPLWQQLARRLPEPFDAAPLFLLGWASWRAGNGALANMAGDRALASDPGYTAADLLLAALTRGVDPRRMPLLRRRPA